MTIVFSVIAAAAILALVAFILVPGKGKTIYVGREHNGDVDRSITLPGPIARMVGNMSRWRVSDKIAGDPSKLETLLMRSGNPWGVTVAQLRALILLSTIAAALAGGLTLGVVGLLLASLVGSTLVMIPIMIVGALTGAAIGFAMPQVVLQSRAKQAIRDIVKELPDTLDLLSMATAVGMSIPQALSATYSFLPEGPMREELGVVKSELAAGVTFAETMTGFAERVPNPSIRAFARMLTDCVADGKDRTEYLRREAQGLRDRQLTVIEAKAGKAEAASMALVALTTLFVAPIPFLVPLLPAISQGGGIGG